MGLAPHRRHDYSLPFRNRYYFRVEEVMSSLGRFNNLNSEDAVVGQKTSYLQLPSVPSIDVQYLCSISNTKSFRRTIPANIPLT